jgi:signal transduction histidine kinase
MQYLGAYLLYAVVVVRSLAWYSDQPHALLVIGLLVAYGVLLVTSQWLTRQPAAQRLPKAYVYTYLIIQTVIVVALLLLPPRPDFCAILFVPLSMQAVLWFERRTGFACITAFIAIMLVPLATGAEAGLSGLALTVLYGAACVLVGNYAQSVKKAERAREENLQLLAKLQTTNGQLQDYAIQVEDLAAAQERNRMARELHDSVTQTVFSMTLAVQAARMLLGKDPARVAAQLDRLQELAKGAVAEIQLLVAQLRPRSPADEGLVAALRRHASEREARDGLRVCVDVITDAPLPQPVAIGLFRIVQEALNNVAKHAGTRQADLRIDLGGNPAYVEVEDHGTGFAVANTTLQRGHVGLASMAERARELGWSFIIDTQPGRGTRIRVEAP